MTATVLITGATRGIGYATAQLFAARGWNVALCGRDAAKADEAARRIAQDGKGDVAGFAADVGDKAAVEQLFARVEKRFPRLDALVNNAAVLHTGGMFEMDEQDFLEMMRVNVEGVVRCCRHAFRIMKAGGGSIVNISSLAGIAHVDKIPGLWGYTASKFAVTGLSEGLAVEGRPFGIRVNCVAPGAVDTDMLRQAAPEFKARAKPDDIAKIIYYLCDPEQSGILTGTTIPVFSND